MKIFFLFPILFYTISADLMYGVSNEITLTSDIRNNRSNVYKICVVIV